MVWSFGWHLIVSQWVTSRVLLQGVAAASTPGAGRWTRLSHQATWPSDQGGQREDHCHGCRSRTKGGWGWNFSLLRWLRWLTFMLHSLRIQNCFLWSDCVAGNKTGNSSLRFEWWCQSIYAVMVPHSPGYHTMEPWQTFRDTALNTDCHHSVHYKL